MPIEIKEPKFIAEEKVPVRITTRSEEWVAFLSKIPKGQALETTRKELGVTASSLKATVTRLIERGQIPQNYYIRQHKKRGADEKIYIINSAHKVVRRKRRTSKEEATESKSS